MKRTVLMDIGDGNYFEISQGDSDQVYGDGVFLHFALRVNDCNAALEVARSAGAEVTMEPRDVTTSSEPPLQLRIAFFKGPDGELIELVQDLIHLTPE
jgi:glyoxylase I family protein